MLLFCKLEATFIGEYGYPLLFRIEIYSERRKYSLVAICSRSFLL